MIKPLAIFPLGRQGVTPPTSDEYNRHEDDAGDCSPTIVKAMVWVSPSLWLDSVSQEIYFENYNSVVLVICLRSMLCGREADN